nr:MAG: polyprotein [Picornavirales sp.]
MMRIPINRDFRLVLKYGLVLNNGKKYYEANMDTSIVGFEIDDCKMTLTVDDADETITGYETGIILVYDKFLNTDLFEDNVKITSIYGQPVMMAADFKKCRVYVTPEEFAERRDREDIFSSNYDNGYFGSSTVDSSTIPKFSRGVRDPYGWCHTCGNINQYCEDRDENPWCDECCEYACGCVCHDNLYTPSVMFDCGNEIDQCGDEEERIIICPKPSKRKSEKINEENRKRVQYCARSYEGYTSWNQERCVPGRRQRDAHWDFDCNEKDCVSHGRPMHYHLHETGEFFYIYDSRAKCSYRRVDLMTTVMQEKGKKKKTRIWDIAVEELSELGLQPGWYTGLDVTEMIAILSNKIHHADKKQGITDFLSWVKSPAMKNLLEDPAGLRFIKDGKVGINIGQDELLNSPAVQSLLNDRRAFDKLKEANVGIELKTKGVELHLFGFIVVIMMYLYLCCVQTNVSNILVLTTMVGVSLGMTAEVMKWVTDNLPRLKEIPIWIKENWNYLFKRNDDGTITENQSRQQAGLDFSVVVDPMVTMITTGMSMVVGAADRRKLPSIVKAGNVANATRSVHSFSGAIIQAINESKDKLEAWWYGVDKEAPLDFIEKFEIVSEYARITICNPTWIADALDKSDESYKSVKTLIQALEVLLLECKENREYLPIVQHTLVEAKKWKKTLEGLLSPGTTCPEPVFIVLQGGTGRGKSKMMEVLIRELYMRNANHYIGRPPTSDKDYFFRKAPDSEYYDGYFGQYGILIDELFQLTDETERSAQASQLFTLVNSVSAPLNMAQCEMKNKVTSTSPVIIATTNLGSWNNLPIVSAPALQRRRDFFVEPIVAPAFANADGSLNARAWTQHCAVHNSQSVKPDYALYQLYGSDDYATGPLLTYDQLVAAISNKIQHNYNSFMNRGPAIDNYLAGIAAQQGIADFRFSEPWEEMISSVSYAKSEDGESIEFHHGVNEKFNIGKELPEDVHKVFEKCFKINGSVSFEQEIQLMRYWLIIHFWPEKKAIAWLRECFPEVDIIYANRLDAATYYEAAHACNLKMSRFQQLAISLRSKIANNPFSVMFGVLALASCTGVLAWLVTWMAGQMKTITDKASNASGSGKGVIRKSNTESRSYDKNVNKRISRRSTAAKRTEGADTSEDISESERDCYLMGLKCETVITYHQEVLMEEHNCASAMQQALIDPTVDAMTGNIYSHMCTAYAMDGYGKVLRETKAMAVRSGAVLIPKHLIYLANDTVRSTIKKVLFSFATVSHTVSIDELVLNSHQIGSRWNYDDVMLYTSTRGEFVFSDITKYFATEKEILEINDGVAELHVLRGNAQNWIRQVFSGYYKAMDNMEVYKVDESLYARTGFYYEHQTKDGDCGSPLVRLDPKATGKIIGIHAAGNLKDNGAGCFAAIVDRDWLISCIKKAGLIQHQESKDYDDGAVVGDNELFHTGIVVHSFVPKEKRVPYPRTAVTYVPTVFQEQKIFPVRTLPTNPCYFSGDQILNSFEKFNRNAPLMNYSRYDTIVKALSLKWFSSDNPDKSILNFSEALNSFNDVNSINSATSMGYPHSIARKKKSSVVYYDEDAKLWKFNDNADSFLTRLNKFDKLIQEGIAPEQIQLIYLKNERKSIEAVKAGKCRTFMSSPFEILLLVRRYFGSFLNFLRNKRHDHGIVIGLNPHEEWDIMTRRLISKNEYVMDLDYESYDRTLPMLFLNAFFDLADLYYQDSHMLERKVIRSVILNPVFQLKHFRFTVISCNGSGNPLTCELNSVPNLVKTIYCLMNQFSLKEILDTTVTASLGDDELISTSLNYNVDKFVDDVSSLGFRPTDPDKKSKPTLKHITKVKFLSRGFELTNGRWSGPLKMETIEETTLWVRKCDNPILALESNIRDALGELEFHNHVNARPVYEKIVTACIKNGLNFPITQHLVDVLATHKESSNFLNRALIGLGLKVWDNMDSTPYELCKQVPEHFINLRVTGRKIPLTNLPNYVCHVGIRDDIRELTYSTKGVVFITRDWSSDWQRNYCFKIEIIQRVVDQYNGLPYQRAQKNCMSFVNDVLIAHNYTGLVEWSLFSEWVKGFMEFDKTFNRQQALGDSDSREAENVELKYSTNYVPPTAGGCLRSIPQLIQTPAIIEQGYWEDRSSQNTVITTIEMPKALLAKPQFRKKLEFNHLMKFDIRFWIKISSPTVNIGSLVAVWVPLSKFGFPGGRDLHVLNFTAMPHAFVNISEDMQFEMIVPYSHICNYISPLKSISLDKLDTLGELRLIVLNQLRVKDTMKKVSYTISANFVNIVVSIPTPLTDVSVWANNNASYPRFKAQQGKEVDDEAAEKTSEGIITGITTAVTSIAEAVAGIPVFSGIGQGVAAISRPISNIARALGLSKPISLAATVPMIPRPFSGVGYKEGLDMSIMLGTDAQNHIQLTPSMFGKNVDEMNLKYIVRTPMCISTLDWSINATKGETIGKFAVHPYMGKSMAVVVNGKPQPAVAMSHMGYISSMFTYWRGSIVVKVQVLATSLHQGMLAIGFIPGGSIHDSVQFDLETTSHKLLDVSLGAEAEVTIPFVSNKMFHRTGNPFDVINLKENVATGTLVIKVFNPLIKTSIVPDTVYVNVWVAAGDDFEVALPTLYHIRTYGYGYQEIKSLSQGIGDRISRTHDDWRFEANPPSFSCIEKENPPDFQDIVMGEKIHNLRDVLKISSLKWVHTEELNGMYEAFIPVSDFVWEDATNQLSETFYNHGARIFRFERGSHNHKVIVSDFEGRVSASCSTLAHSLVYSWIETDTPENTPWAVCVPALNPTLEYRVPFFSDYKNKVLGAKLDMSAVRILLTSHKKKKITLSLFQAIGDDYSAGYLMGPPVIYQHTVPPKSLLGLLEGVFSGPQVFENKFDGTYVGQAIKNTQVARQELAISHKNSLKSFGDVTCPYVWYVDWMEAHGRTFFISELETPQNYIKKHSSKLFEVDLGSSSTKKFVFWRRSPMSQFQYTKQWYGIDYNLAENLLSYVYLYGDCTGEEMIVYLITEFKKFPESWYYTNRDLLFSMLSHKDLKAIGTLKVVYPSNP